MTESPYPHARPWKDRHGRVRWRFRKGTRTVYLDGAPGDPGFLPSYEAALAGRSKPKATVTRLSTAATPRWTHAAGLPKGCTIHGLRKTLGKLIADAGGSSRQSMAALGHDDLKQAELYREASDREMQARDAMVKVTALIERRKAAG